MRQNDPLHQPVLQSFLGRPWHASSGPSRLLPTCPPAERSRHVSSADLLCMLACTPTGASRGPAPWPCLLSSCAGQTWWQASVSASWAVASAWRAWRRRRQVRKGLDRGPDVPWCGASFGTLPVCEVHVRVASWLVQSCVRPLLRPGWPCRRS